MENFRGKASVFNYKPRELPEKKLSKQEVREGHDMDIWFLDVRISMNCNLENYFSSLFSDPILIIAFDLVRIRIKFCP